MRHLLSEVCPALTASTTMRMTADDLDDDWGVVEAYEEWLAQARPKKDQSNDDA
jgi:hypothetical protein